MAGVDESQYNFKGLKYYFNSYTQRGKFNWVACTYGTLIASILYFRRRKKNKAVAAIEGIKK